MAGRESAPPGPAATPCRDTVLIASAMGVSQEFYARLAAWLAEQGLRA